MKYKSPHPQDLSFPKDQDLRVLGYADRGAEEEEAEEEAGVALVELLAIISQWQGELIFSYEKR